VYRHGFRLPILVLASVLLAGVASAQEPAQLRVCADPDNLPFSNKSGEGFENKIAELVGGDLGVPVSYFWWPHQRGLVRRTLGEDHCDVLIGIPQGFDPVLTTKPYYRSAYAVVSKHSTHAGITSLDDPALKQLKIGVHVDTPPYAALGERGLMDNVHSYSLIFDPRLSDPSRRPTKLLEDLKDGAIDVAIVWGPMAGYFAKKTGTALDIVPLKDSGRIPMSFEVSMGVRKADKALKARLETAIDHKASEIKKILADYGVPVLGTGP
jgi:mxaJ protein